MLKTNLDTTIKTLAKTIRFDRVSIARTTVNTSNGITTFMVTFSVVYQGNTYEYDGFARFPEISINDKIWELWLVCIYLHALNLQPLTKSMILPPKELSRHSIRFCEDLHSHNYQIWHKVLGRSGNICSYNITDYEQCQKYKIPDGIGVAMSGGKESILCFHMMEDLGYKTVPIFVDYIGRIQRREGSSMYNKLTGDGKHPVSIQSDLIDLLRLFPLEFGKHSMYLSPTIMLILMYSYNAGLRTLVVGNEYDNTCPIIEPNGVPYYGDNYEQSTVFERKLTQYLKDISINIEVFSPIYGLSETCIQYLVTKTPYLDFQESCLQPISKSGKVHSCGICSKCKRIAAIMTALGYKSPYFSSDIFSVDPNQIFNSQNGLNEAETLLYLVNHQGYNISSDIESAFHWDIFENLVDDSHPIISKRIKTYLDSRVPKSLNTIIGVSNYERS